MTIRSSLTLILVFIFSFSLVSARPEIIVEGKLYYSHEIEEDAEIKELIGEKNFEEVYRNYTYYEAIYDNKKRLKSIKEFERGDVVWVEKYTYGKNGRLEKIDKIE